MWQIFKIFTATRRKGKLLAFSNFRTDAKAECFALESN